VGKSTLIHLLKEGRLPPAKLSSTHGLEFSTWKTGWSINDSELMVNIIDFGGQEYYHGTHHLFFNERALFLLMWQFDSNDNMQRETPVGTRDKMEAIQHFNVQYWINAIDIYTRTLPKSIVAKLTERLRLLMTTSDIEHLEPGPEPEAQRGRRVKYHWKPSSSDKSSPPVLLVQTYMDEHGKRFLNMEDLQERYRALAGNVSVSMDIIKGTHRGVGILQDMIRSLFEDMPGLVGQDYDESWITIREYIEEHEKERYRIMGIVEFRMYFIENALGGDESLYSEQDVQTLCITLNYWGVVLYRYDIIELRDTVIINPQFFARQINKLLTEALLGRNGGMSRDEILEKLRLDAEAVEAFIKVLTEFKVLFELPCRGADGILRYVAPMYLGKKPTHVSLFLSQFVAYYKIRYDGYFHKGILLDCFKELGGEVMCEKDLYFCWQGGLVLRRDDRVICIEFDDVHLDQVKIRTIRKGNEQIGRDPFLRDIFKAFERINRNYRIDIEMSCDGVDFVSKKLLLEKGGSGLNKFDLGGKTFDVRDHSFLLGPEEGGTSTKRVFISYSSKDRKALDSLESHLRSYKKAELITYWHDLFLSDREQWNEQIGVEMEKANILIMLLSPDYLGTDYIVEKEIPIALEALRQPKRTKQVFWVLFRPCQYEMFAEVSKYPIYPLKELDAAADRAVQKAIAEHDNQDRQWVKLLKRILEET
jgi:hypothetical protein